MNNNEKKIEKLNTQLQNNQRRIVANEYVLNDGLVCEKEANENVNVKSGFAIKYGLSVPALTGAVLGGLISLGAIGVTIGAGIGLIMGVLGTAMFMTINTKQNEIERIKKNKTKENQSLDRQNKKIMAELKELAGDKQEVKYEQYKPETKETPQNVVIVDNHNNTKQKSGERDM